MGGQVRQADGTGGQVGGQGEGQEDRWMEQGG